MIMLSHCIILICTAGFYKKITNKKLDKLGDIIDPRWQLYSRAKGDTPLVTNWNTPRALQLSSITLHFIFQIWKGRTTVHYLVGVGSPINSTSLPSHNPCWKCSKVSQRSDLNPISLLMDSANKGAVRTWLQWSKHNKIYLSPKVSVFDHPLPIILIWL